MINLHVAKMIAYVRNKKNSKIFLEKYRSCFADFK